MLLLLFWLTERDRKREGKRGGKTQRESGEGERESTNHCVILPCARVCILVCMQHNSDHDPPF